MKKRKYYRKCGSCGVRDEQSNMVRVSSEYADNGWLCKECNEIIDRLNDIDYDLDEF